jgi:hypothetical protein
MVGVRPKHVEEYTRDKYKNKDVAFGAVVTLLYKGLYIQ